MRDDGGIVDDLVIYRRSAKKFLVVVNASNTEKDYAWIESIAVRFRKANPSIEFKLSNESAAYTQIAIQGPKAAEITQTLTRVHLAPVKTYWFAEGMAELNDGGPAIKTIFARTGYTGEDGFELYVPWSEGPRVWRALLAAGAPLGLKPCGLGARDTLRLEMKYPLYGHELTDETNPLEAGLSWVVKMAKERFVGKDALKRIQEGGLSRALVGLKLLERGIPRQGYGVWNAEGTEQIGEITSGTQSPSTQQAIGIAYVAREHSAPGTRIQVEIRGTKVPAEVVPTPFYKKP
jgi:aminomethyltransferase